MNPVELAKELKASRSGETWNPKTWVQQADQLVAAVLAAAAAREKLGVEPARDSFAWSAFTAGSRLLLADQCEILDLRRHAAECEAVELRARDRWIPVGERLPEETGPHKRYLCLDKNGIYEVCWKSSDRHKWFLQYSEDEVPDVTHWRELPEAPKEGI